MFGKDEDESYEVIPHTDDNTGKKSRKPKLAVGVPSKNRSNSRKNMRDHVGVPSKNRGDSRKILRDLNMSKSPESQTWKSKLYDNVQPKVYELPPKIDTKTSEIKKPESGVKKSIKKPKKKNKNDDIIKFNSQNVGKIYHSSPKCKIVSDFSEGSENIEVEPETLRSNKKRPTARKRQKSKKKKVLHSDNSHSPQIKNYSSAPIQVEITDDDLFKNFENFVKSNVGDKSVNKEKFDIM